METKDEEEAWIRIRYGVILLLNMNYTDIEDGFVDLICITRRHDARLDHFAENHTGQRSSLPPSSRADDSTQGSTLHLQQLT